MSAKFWKPASTSGFAGGVYLRVWVKVGETREALRLTAKANCLDNCG